MTDQRATAEGWAVVGVVLLAVVAYGVTVHFGFAFDDVHIIQRNSLVHGLARWQDILTATWWDDAAYRPVTLLSFGLDWSLAKGAPGFFHGVNVVLHAAVTAATYALLRRSLGPLGAALAAALFAVHPVHVEAVANIVGRNELLAGLFTLGAALTFRTDAELAAARRRGWGRVLTSLGTLALLGLALGSKEIAFAAPGILLLVDWLDARSSGQRPADRFRRHWVLWVGTVALTTIWLWMWVGRVGELGVGRVAPGLEGEGMVGRAIAMSAVVPEYLRLLIVPTHLSIDYSPDFLTVTSQLTLRAGLGLALVAGSLATAWWLRHRAPVVTFGILWTAGTLFVVSNILVPGEVILAERTLYLPSVGAVAVVGWLPTLVRSNRRRIVLWAGAAVVLLGLLKTLSRAPVWRDNETVFPQLVRDAPGSYRAAWVAGMLAYQRGDRREGEKLLRQAASVNPIDAGLWTDLAARMEEDRRWEEAASFYRAAYAVDPRRTDAAGFAVVNLVRADHIDSAETLATRAYAADAENSWLKIALGDVAMARGRPLEAMTWRRRVALEFPHVWQYWYLTADAALAAGYCPEAERSVSRLRTLRADAEPLPDLGRRGRKLGCWT